MNATPEAMVSPDARTADPKTRWGPSSRMSGTGARRRIGLPSRVAARAAMVVAAVIGLGGLLTACKSGPHASDGAKSSRSKSSKTGDETPLAADSKPVVSASEARLVRLDATVKEWDAAQGAGRDDAARALAAKIADEVDRDFGYFDAASKGEHGLRVQNLAVEVLAFSRNRSATTLLVDRLHDLDGSVVGNALIGLKIRSDPETPIRPLIVLLKADFPEARRYAPLALANVAKAREDARRPIEANLSDAAMSGLVGLVQDNDPYARLHAAKAMGALRRPDATDFLTLLLKDERATIRIAAAAALERIGDPRSFPSVVELLDRVPDDQKAIVCEILASYAGHIQGRPLSAAEKKSFDVSARAWDRWFASRDTAKVPSPAADR